MSAFARSKKNLDESVCDAQLAENVINAKNKNRGTLRPDNLSVNSEPSQDEVSLGSTCNGIIQQDAKPRLAQVILSARPRVEDIIWATFQSIGDPARSKRVAEETKRFYFQGTGLERRVRALDAVTAFGGQLTNELLAEFSSKRLLYFPNIHTLSQSPGLDTNILNYVNGGGILIVPARTNAVRDTITSIASSVGVNVVTDVSSGRYMNVLSTELGVSTYADKLTSGAYFTNANDDYDKNYFIQYEQVSTAVTDPTFNVPSTGQVFGDTVAGTNIISNTRDAAETPIDLTAFDMVVGSKVAPTAQVSGLNAFPISALTQIATSSFGIADPAFNTVTKVPLEFTTSRQSTQTPNAPRRDAGVSVQYGEGRLVLISDYFFHGPTVVSYVDSATGDEYEKADTLRYFGTVMENWVGVMVSQLLAGLL